MTTADPLGSTTDTYPRLRRSGTDRMLGGVSGGLAEYTGIDTVLWRVAFVALTLLGGSGVLFYAVLWVLMPAGSPHPDTPVERGVDRLRTALLQPRGGRRAGE
jgi:phage shock protein PspC (stress-responsive transcriptional regulator)